MTYFVGADISYAPAQQCMDTHYPPSVHMHLGHGIVACGGIRQYRGICSVHWASLDIEAEILSFLLEPSAGSLSKTSIAKTNENVNFGFDQSINFK